MGKPYYYLGYLVPGSKTMSYKAGFAGAELWDGHAWHPMPARDIDHDDVKALLTTCEDASMQADAASFRLEAQRELEPPPGT